MQENYTFNIYINNMKIKCSIIKKNIKNVYIGIKDKSVYIRAPKRVTNKQILEFVDSKKNWIYKNIQKDSRREDKKINLKSRNYIYILGNKIDVNYICVDNNKIKVDLDSNHCNIFIPTCLKNSDNFYDMAEKKLNDAIKEFSRSYINNAMSKYISTTGLIPKQVNIRKYKGIWGNCSSKGIININQNVVFFDEKVIEYVCLHEIAHLKYMNHQKQFWNFIFKYMPDYDTQREKLKN